MKNGRKFTPHSRTIPTDSSGKSYGVELDRYLDRLLGDELDEPHSAGDAPPVLPQHPDKS